MPEQDPGLAAQIAANPLPWICGVLAVANSTQYARDWFRERRYQAAARENAIAIAEAERRHRETMEKMLPTLTLVLDEMRKS